MTISPFEPSEPLPNVPLLRKVREHIEAHPEEWRQNDWRTVRDCGTAYCFAGWACQIDGGEWILDSSWIDGGEWVLDSSWIDGGLDSSWLEPRPDDPPGCIDAPCGIDGIRAGARARRILGLTADEADELFCAHNTLYGIDRALAGIYARAGERP